MKRMSNIHPEMLKQLKRYYSPGTRIVLDRMNDPYTKLKPGDTGTVSFVDDAGTIHVDWDNGSFLGVVFNEDSCHKLE